MKGAIAVAAAASMASACSLVFGPSTTDSDARPRDAGMPDVPLLPDGDFDCNAWGTRTYFDACSLPAAGPRLSIQNPGIYQFDTDALLLSHSDIDVDDIPPYFAVVIRQRDDSELAVISTIDFSLGTGVRLRAVGERPLLVASWGPIELDNGAVLDVSGYVTAIGSPAGATSGDCTGHDAGQDQAGGGGGGMGSSGGIGGNNSLGTETGGAGGEPLTPTGVIGGCDGGAGRPKSNRQDGESTGGGAVALSALGAITIRGEIHAGGAGGSGGVRLLGGQEPGGGDGGGSGGMIVLEAPSISQQGEVDAIGGGGGGGGSNLAAGKPGLPGWAPGPLLTTPGAGGAGGGGSPAGGRGGDGSNVTDLPGGDGVDANGFSLLTGGGGGGAAGQVLVIAGEF